jgi:hypothetical protein
MMSRARRARGGLTGAAVVAAVVTAVVAAAYAWWATGVPPFGVRAYVAVGIPVLLVALALALPPIRDPTRSRIAAAPVDTPAPIGNRSFWPSAYPWLILLALAAILEGIALALGGRSSAVPTLSTVVDHALGRHPVRFVLFCVWLGIGVIPSIRGRLRGLRRVY